MLNQAATRELWNYQLFVLVGGVMAWHYQEVHGWLCRHWRGLLVAMVVAVGFSEGWYLLATHHVPGFRTGYPSDPFQPVEIPLYLGLITAIYLLGVLLAREGNPRWLRRLVQAGADYSYGIYLSQVLFLTALVTLGWPSLQHDLPWPVVTFGGIVIVYAAATGLTMVLARLPGARATAGLPRRPWRVPPRLRPKAPPIRDLGRNSRSRSGRCNPRRHRPAFAVTSFRGRLGASSGGVRCRSATQTGAGGRGAGPRRGQWRRRRGGGHAQRAGHCRPAAHPRGGRGLTGAGPAAAAGRGGGVVLGRSRGRPPRSGLAAGPGPDHALAARAQRRPRAGYVNPGAGHRGPFAKLAGRLHLARTDPGTIIIQGGHDDIGRPLPLIRARVEALIASVHRACPRSRLAVLTVFRAASRTRPPRPPTGPSWPRPARPTPLSSCSTRSPATGSSRASATTCTRPRPGTSGSPTSWPAACARTACSSQATGVNPGSWLNTRPDLG